jgi:hypothetical protein
MIRPTNKSTLITPGVFDQIRSRLRERAEDYGCDIGDGYCLNCGAQLTEADVEAGECKQCCSSLDVVDESADEHLHEDDEDLNGWELGYDD